jgi:hypothetical protein
MIIRDHIDFLTLMKIYFVENYGTEKIIRHGGIDTFYENS